MLKRKYLYLLLIPQLCFAFDLSSLWINNNQKARQLMKQNNNKEAAEKFDNSQWKGVAYYKDAQYDRAYAEFSKGKSALGYYNQGNALAQQHKYSEAISAYEESLKLDKNNQDATDNIELLKKLMEQDKQDHENKDKQEQNKDDSQKSDKGNPQNSQDQQQDKSDSQKSEGNHDENSSGQQQDKQQDNSAKENSSQQQNKNQPEQNTTNNQQKPDKPDKPDKKEQSQLEQSNNDKAKDEQPATNSAQMTPEQKQEQKINAVLSQIPDDPGGLLRNKFLRDYQNQQGYNQ